MKYDKPLVEIIWLDAKTEHGWEPDADVELDINAVTTIGFLLQDNENIVVIASSIDRETATNNGRMYIPKGMVVSMNELVTSKKKPKKIPLVNPQSEELQLPLPL